MLYNINYEITRKVISLSKCTKLNQNVPHFLILSHQALPNNVLFEIADPESVYNHNQQVVAVHSPPLASGSANIFYIAVGCACALIAVIVTMVMAYYIKTKKMRRGGMLQYV